MNNLKGWIKTDDMQWRKEVNETTYHLIEVRENPDGYNFVSGIIDIDDYDKKDILSYINGYGYESEKMMRDTYKDETNGVIAECIFECTSEIELNCFGIFETEEEACLAAKKYIKVQDKFYNS